MRHGLPEGDAAASPQDDGVGGAIPDVVRVTDYIGHVLAPDLPVLLRTESPPVLAHRLTHLDPEGGRDDDVGELDAAIAHQIADRRSWWRGLSRLATVLAFFVGVVVAAVTAASYLGEVWASLVRVSWLRWPPPRRTTLGLLIGVAVCWSLIFAAVWCRGRELVGRCRLACRIAAVHDLDTWPGIAMDPPFGVLGARWTFPGWSFVVAAVALLGVTASQGQASWPVWVVALAWAGVGGWLIAHARLHRRAQRLAAATLFVGVED